MNVKKPSWMPVRACIVSLVLTACAHKPLSVQTEYFRPKDLASYIIDTPDPDKEADIFGQRICISWNIPQARFSKNKAQLSIAVRLKNGDEKAQTIALETRSGSMLYPVVGPDFFVKGGILSYLIRLESEGELIAESKHRFWVEKVSAG